MISQIPWFLVSWHHSPTHRYCPDIKHSHPIVIIPSLSYRYKTLSFFLERRILLHCLVGQECASTQRLERLACVAKALPWDVCRCQFFHSNPAPWTLSCRQTLDASLAGSRAFSCYRVHLDFLRWGLSRTYSPNVQLITQNNSLFPPYHVAS